MSSLQDRLKTASHKEVAKTVKVLTDATLFDTTITSTALPVLNIALSGTPDGGFCSGYTAFAGDSKNFKTLFCMICVKAFLDADPEAECVFYDSEFGAAKKYWDALNIDADRVLHIPVEDVEELMFDVSMKLDELTKKDKVIFFLDSLGGLASKKELDDAEVGKSVKDMSRAQAIKSFFRVTNVKLMKRDIPFFFIGHTYGSMEMFSKTIVSGGKGVMLACQNLFIIGKQQIRDGKTLLGYNFVVNIEKSRFINEKLKFPIPILQGKSIDKYAGMLEVAEKIGVVHRSSPGIWKRRVTNENGDVIFEDDSGTRTKAIDKAFWAPFFGGEFTELFARLCKTEYQLGAVDLISLDDE